MSRNKSNQNEERSDRVDRERQKKFSLDIKTLFTLVKEDKVEDVKKLLEDSKWLTKILSAVDEYGNTLLTKACINGSYKMVIVLLNAGSTEEGLDKCYGNSYVYKISDHNKTEIYLELSSRNFLKGRSMKKINEKFYEINTNY